MTRRKRVRRRARAGFKATPVFSLLFLCILCRNGLDLPLAEATHQDATCWSLLTTRSHLQAPVDTYKPSVAGVRDDSGKRFVLEPESAYFAPTDVSRSGISQHIPFSRPTTPLETLLETRSETLLAPATQVGGPSRSILGSRFRGH